LPLFQRSAQVVLRRRKCCWTRQWSRDRRPLCEGVSLVMCA